MGAEDASARSARLYVSETREYLVYRDACLRVRDRATGRWLPVLPNRVVGAVPAKENDAGMVSDSPPRVGERLCIQVRGRRLLSEPILSVEAVSLSPPAAGDAAAAPLPVIARARAQRSQR